MSKLFPEYKIRKHNSPHHTFTNSRLNTFTYPEIVKYLSDTGLFVSELSKNEQSAVKRILAQVHKTVDELHADVIRYAEELNT